MVLTNGGGVPDRERDQCINDDTTDIFTGCMKPFHYGFMRVLVSIYMY